MTSEQKAKIEFAKGIVSGETPFAVATRLFPSDTGLALRICNEWQRDEYVLSEVANLLDAGHVADIPSKESFALFVFNAAKSIKSADDKIKFLRLFAEVSGYITKGETKVDLTINNKVMTISDKGTDADWSAKLIESQRKLKGDAEETQH
jgi:hypothetical protein